MTVHELFPWYGSCCRLVKKVKVKHVKTDDISDPCTVFGFISHRKWPFIARQTIMVSLIIVKKTGKLF